MSEQHALIGIIVAIMLSIMGLPLPYIVLIVMVSIFIDIDHFFYYIIKFKKYNPFKMNKYFRRYERLRNSTTMLPIFIFHNFETIIILLILSFIFPIMFYVLIGVLLHMIMDWIVMPTKKYPMIIKLSLILVLLENRRRKNGHSKW